MASLPLHRRLRRLSWVKALERRVRMARGTLQAEAPARVATSGYFGADEIDWVCDTYFQVGAAPGTAWDLLRHAHMRLPGWFRHGLDPWSEAYAAQQQRLWQLVAAVDRPYAPEVDEKEHDWGDVDPVRAPGYFVRRDPLAVASASDHVIATGMILKHAGVAPGDWALEYGAGFGQTALTLARLGVNVDTVDISATFCEFVRRQSEYFRVPLTAFDGPFGMNPRPGKRYRLIWFYESFHHCVDFLQVVQRLGDHLAEGGRVILAGEPIVEREYDAVPYPWGVRLHSEVVAVVRKLHWFELGFSEDYLFELFTRAGFVGRRVDCEPSLFGRLHVFERRPDDIDLGRHWLPTVLADEWHVAEADGRWTTATSRLPLDTGSGFDAIQIDLANPRFLKVRVELTYGTATQCIVLDAGARTTATFPRAAGASQLLLRCRRGPTGVVDRLRARSPRPFGVLVRRLRYLATAPSS